MENELSVINTNIKKNNFSIDQKYKEITNLKQTIQQLEHQRKKICSQLHTDCWESRREPGPYGEKFGFCTKCNCEV